MALNKSLLAAVVIILLATTLLISSLDYSSAVITTGSGPSGAYKFVGKDQGPSNHTGNSTGGGSDHEAEKNGGNASSAFNGLFGRDPGDGDPSSVADSGNSLLFIGVAAATVTAVVIITVIIVRRRRRNGAVNPSASQTVAVPAPPALPVSHEGIYRLQFPQIREPYPLTWGVDESLEMVVIREDAATADAMLSIDGENSLVRLVNGKAVIPLKLPKGDHRITVSPNGNATPGSESWVILRIVDYREEVVRMFNEMCLRYLPVSGDEKQEMTPREIELLIGVQMPESKQKSLDMAVSAFERANYSLHDVRRADYEVMYTSEVGMV